ncbi:MAG: TonB-dependent receptor [Opitutaceae bacterium]|nr:TonB-dependent receptor [Opitutaceae bacterium]
MNRTRLSSRLRRLGRTDSQIHWLRHLLALACVTSLCAQSIPVKPPIDPKSVKDSDEAIVMEQVEVTGSLIPFPRDGAPIPIQVITAEDIAATGEAGDLLEAIKKASPKFVGNGNIGSSNANVGGGSTNGGSQLRLRNLSTLVLINGRRAAYAPVGATGGYTFVDINSIPIAVVERIEILSDGASATYGSDAVSGVVNVILKRDFSGVEVGANYRMATRHGDWSSRSVHVAAGNTIGRTSLTASVEWFKMTPLFQNQRGFSANQTGKTLAFPGSVFDFSAGAMLLAPNLDAPPLNSDRTPAQLVAQGIYEGPLSSDAIAARFNLASSVTLLLGYEKLGMTVAFSHRFSDRLEAFGDVLFARTLAHYQLAAQPINGMPYESAFVVDAGLGAGIAAPNHPQNPSNYFVLPRNRFVDFPRLFDHDTASIRTLAGLRGSLGKTWTWEAAVNGNKVRQDYANSNLIDRAALARAIDTGLVNLFARTQDPAKLRQAGIFGTATSLNESALYSIDGRITGTIDHVLPAGPIRFAVGAESRREELSATPDSGSYTVSDPANRYFANAVRWDGAGTTDPSDASRNVDAVFAQVRIPILRRGTKAGGLHAMDLDLAGRHEIYSDTENPFVPKVMLRVLPFNDRLAFRATYSESFSAPPLYFVGGPVSLGRTDSVRNFLRADGQLIASSDQANVRTPPNPGLKPETSRNVDFGVVYSHRFAKSLTIELSWFQIEQSDLVGVVNSIGMLQDVELRGIQSPYYERVRVGSFNGPRLASPGLVSYFFDFAGGSFAPFFINSLPENLSESKQQGLDILVDYTRNVEGLGKFTVRGAAMWYDSFTVGGRNYVGTTTGNAALNGGTVPRWNINLYTAWERGDWKTGVFANYLSSVNDIRGQTFDQFLVESYASADWFIERRFRGGRGRLSRLDGLTLRLGVTNVTNEMPPSAPASWTDANADVGTYRLIGRTVFLDARYKF